MNLVVLNLQFWRLRQLINPSATLDRAACKADAEDKWMGDKGLEPLTYCV